jgi:hypothetical protein
MAKKKKQSTRTIQLSDRSVYLLLVLVSILIRVPFLRTYDFVAYDGTYYINHAKTLLGMMSSPSGFPIGYPVLIALFVPLIHDGVRAAQTVSFLAGIGSLIVFYSLAKRFIPRGFAFVAALVLALTPLFIALSMLTLSESTYILWMLLGLYCFAVDRDLLTGLFMGMAAITRPEAIGILGILAVLRIRRPTGLVRIVSGFAVPFCVNVAALSTAAGKLILVPKTGLFGTSASPWKLREAWVDFPGKEHILERIRDQSGSSTILADYLKRMPRELLLLVRHASPVVFALSIYGMLRRRSFLIAALAPFLIFPLFTPRSEPRFILPYVPVLILYSFMAVELLRKYAAYRLTYALIILSAAACVFVNRAQLTTPLLPGAEWAKNAASDLKGKIEPGARIADRDPFFAFYVEGKYVEIPMGPYDETLEYLANDDVDYLVLHKKRIDTFRPALKPLLYDRACINGEMRFAQVGHYADFALIYRRTMESDPAKRRYLVPLLSGQISGLSWSPDGQAIAYCMADSSGARGIYTISPDGSRRRLLVSDPNVAGPLAWAPDSKHIAFTSKQEGASNIYVSDESGKVTRITSHPSTDAASSWSRDGREILFCSTLSGQYEIWLLNLKTGALRRISTDGDNVYPAESPDGKYIAWTRRGQGIAVYDRGTGVIGSIDSPKDVSFTPAWSPDGRFIAVTASDWQKMDIYLLSADGRSTALLTKSSSALMGIPTWSPDGRSLAVVVNKYQKMGIVILTGLEPYEDRLTNPGPVTVFKAIN